jgi:galactokinase
MNASLRQRALASFFGTFNTKPTLLVHAPGRVNLIGEHTDYNDGFVLPCAINFHTLVAASPRQDSLVRVLASDCGQAVDEFSLDAAIEPRAMPAWANYVRGVFAMLMDRGHALQGMNLAIAGDVPRGAGLSSSASLEVAVARTVQALSGLDGLTPTDLAQVAQRAENIFVGCQCGIMDQLVSASGVQGHALLIDCRDLQTRPVPIPPQTAVLIVHSNVRRGLVDSQYNLRRQECRRAAQHLGAASLREVSMPDLLAGRGSMDDVAYRRARHVLTENARTLQAADALACGDLGLFGRLMAESQHSMREDFEITVPAIDQLVDVLQQAIGHEGGARMTGGGFGGCAVAVLPEGRVPEVLRAVATGYRSPEGLPGTVHVCPAMGGVQAETLGA